MPSFHPRARIRARLRTMFVTFVVLFGGLLGGQALLPVASNAADTTPVVSVPSQTKPVAATGPKNKFKVATLNLRKGMRVPGLRHDIGKMLKGGASVIGFQERLFSRKALRASLPKHWRLLMPSGGETGTDDNPIAYNKQVWKLQQTWTPLLALRTWRRLSGQMAHAQYGVAGVLIHRKSGHIIRAVSFHLPNHLHNRHTGGPNFGNRGGVETMWRMAKRLRYIGATTPEEHQLVLMCDCNVTASRDTGKLLVKGRISGPLGLETNYSVGGYRPGWQIDYVMGERDSDFRISSYRIYHKLVTDHPGVLTTFVRKT